MRILVVEDNQIARFAYQFMLEQESINADFAEDGAQAVTMANNQYDAILMDVNLPILSGIEATKKIRSNTNRENQPIIIGITADNDPKCTKSCIDAGMDEVLNKPAPMEKIIATIKKYLS